MIVIIKSSPDTPEGKRGVKIARDMAADVVLLQNGVYFLKAQALEDLGFVGTAYVLDDDIRLRGLSTDDRKDIQEINYDSLIDLIIKNDKVTGMF
jgi:sulfur relay protein TusB/DsrH